MCLPLFSQFQERLQVVHSWQYTDNNYTKTVEAESFLLISWALITDLYGFTLRSTSVCVIVQSICMCSIA